MNGNEGDNHGKQEPQTKAPSRPKEGKAFEVEARRKANGEACRAWDERVHNHPVVRTLQERVRVMSLVIAQQEAAIKVLVRVAAGVRPSGGQHDGSGLNKEVK